MPIIGAGRKTQGAACNPSPCTGVTATLALGADNTIRGLADNPGNTTSVVLNGHTLTLAPLSGTLWSYAGSIVDGSSSGNFVQNGPGTSILTGNSTYTGTTAVNAGILDVEGRLGGTSGVVVNSGGTLTGGGTIDPLTVTINSGGTFAPGTPGIPGTSMTIVGNLAFQSGALYVTQINSAAATFANVTGTASLGGTVVAVVEGSGLPQKQYAILKSAGLGGTTFSNVVSADPNFATSLSYTNTNVLLNLTATLGAGSALNGNQQAVANTLSNAFNTSGTLPANFGTLFGLTGTSLGNALTQLDGEAATGAERSAFQMMTQFLGLMLDPFVAGRGSVGPGGQAIAFAPDEAANLPPDIALAYASVLKAPPPTFDQRWTAWGGAYGGSNIANGNASSGSSNVTASTFGFAAGMDYHVAPGTFVGFALAGGGTNWGLASGFGNGRSDAMQAGVYGVTHMGPAYLAGALAFTNHWFATNRSALGGQLSANFDGQSYGARLESGYRFAVLPRFGVTPYAALQAQDFRTPSYSESDATGSGFALTYAAMNATDVRSEIGARFDNPTVIGGKLPLILRARFAWAHDSVTNPALSAAFETVPGGSFTVNGAPIAQNSALTSAAAELFLTSNLSLLAKIRWRVRQRLANLCGFGNIALFLVRTANSERKSLFAVRCLCPTPPRPWANRQTPPASCWWRQECQAARRRR
jgi:autotransporter-associated beta strand protein